VAYISAAVIAIAIATTDRRSSSEAKHTASTLTSIEFSSMSGVKAKRDLGHLTERR